LVLLHEPAIELALCLVNVLLGEGYGAARCDDDAWKKGDVSARAVDED
jgi:hypothetical protein